MQIAYRGKSWCRAAVCRRNLKVPERCDGWHCSFCDEPSGDQGHPACREKKELTYGCG
jgi:hypothetical protein